MCFVRFDFFFCLLSVFFSHHACWHKPMVGCCAGGITSKWGHFNECTTPRCKITACLGLSRAATAHLLQLAWSAALISASLGVRVTKVAWPDCTRLHHATRSVIPSFRFHATLMTRYVILTETSVPEHIVDP
ncbi:hypothetical protein IWX90DRAFT_239812 [Phyllosticta citrichinensis]|uniref:Secreted protein n=1 Tax=Phyllosticta citrichinensis TaxID=1130410 RepID=A0ABR1XQ51_9PEZI